MKVEHAPVIDVALGAILAMQVSVAWAGEEEHLSSARNVTEVRQP